jgi:hypothetical protein
MTHPSDTFSTTTNRKQDHDMNHNISLQEIFAVTSITTVKAGVMAERLQRHCDHDGGRRTFTIASTAGNTFYLHAESVRDMRALAARLTLLADAWQDEVTE